MKSNKRFQKILDDIKKSTKQFYPFLWAGTETLENRKSGIVPMKEIIGLEFEFLEQIYKQSSL